MSENKKDAPQDGQPSKQKRTVELDPTVKFEIHEQVEHRVEKEIGRVTKFYNIIGVVVIVAFGIAGVYSVRDLTQKFLNTTEAAAKVKTFTEKYDQFQASYSDYTNRLAELKTYDDIITSKDLKTNLFTLEAKIQSVDRLRADSRKTLKELKEASDFYFSLNDVRSTFNRPAFQKLRAIASDENNSFSDRARGEVLRITQSATNFPVTVTNGQPMIRGAYSWRSRIDPQNASFEEAKNEFGILKNNMNVPRLLSFVAHNPNYTKGQKVSFMIQVFHEAESPRGEFAAELFLKAEDKVLQDLPPFSFDQIEKWWEENQSKYSTN